MVADSSIVNKKVFSEMVGVSRPAITKACKANRLGMVGSKINLEHRRTKEYIRSHLEKSAAKKIIPKKSKPGPVEPITAPVDDSPPGNPDTEPDDGYALPPGIKCFEDITIHNIHRIPQDLIKKVKELEIAKKAKQDREVKRGELIKRDLVKQFTAKLHTVDTNQWKTLEDKIMPELCGMFEVQDGSPEAIKARKLISEEVSKILRFVKRQIDEFFIDNEEVVG
jgi:hypothetical protein